MLVLVSCLRFAFFCRDWASWFAVSLTKSSRDLTGRETDPYVYPYSSSETTCPNLMQYVAWKCFLPSRNVDRTSHTREPTHWLSAFKPGICTIGDIICNSHPVLTIILLILKPFKGKPAHRWQCCLEKAFICEQNNIWVAFYHHPSDIRVFGHIYGIKICSIVGTNIKFCEKSHCS